MVLERFPAMPDAPLSRDEAEPSASRARAAVEAWRAAWTAWLEGPRDDGISEAMAVLLLELLGARESEGFRAYRYRLSRFPTSGSLREVLLWRAGLVDMLSDVWDRIGEAAFGFEECQRVSALLVPAGADAPRICALCLGAEPPPSSALHYEACEVQRAWRAGA